MKLEHATLDDATEISSLINSAFRDEGGWTQDSHLIEGQRIFPHTIEADLKKPNGVMLKGVDDDGRIIACVSGEKRDDGSFYIGTVSVLPFMQGKGLGSKLMKAMEEIGREMECKRATLLTVLTRQEVISWYEKRGYSLNGHKEKFPDDGRYGFPRQRLDLVGLEKEL